MSDEAVAVLVAAGAGRRMGGDKLWNDLWGRPVWRWGLDALLSVPDVARVVVVVPPGAAERFAAALPADAGERVTFVDGGERRIDSVVAGLQALTAAAVADETPVLVHDAARPGVPAEVLRAVLDAVRGGAAAIPVVAVPDSLKSVAADGRVLGNMDRESLVAAQTPQGATLVALRSALEEAHAWGRDVTDEAAALTTAGYTVHTVPGLLAGRKLTEPDDLALLRGAVAAWAAPFAARQVEPGQRAGVGFDAHRFEAGRPLRLGGLEFPGEPGLAGHSDGDAALHALIDALLGAATAGDIGSLYPAEDDRWRKADSGDLLRGAVTGLAAAGWRPVAVDLTIVAAHPAIAPRRDEMRARIGTLLGLSPDDVSVKGTTSDGLGFAGREGIAAFAVAIVARG